MGIYALTAVLVLGAIIAYSFLTEKSTDARDQEDQDEP